MRTNILILFSIILSTIYSNTAFSQVSIESLTKENANLKNSIRTLKQDTTYLRKVVSTCQLIENGKETEVINTNSLLKFEFLKCVGDRNAQTVKIEFFINHELPHQLFQLHTGEGQPRAYDFLGTWYSYKSAQFGNNPNPTYAIGVIPVIVPTGVRIKGEIVFRNVLASTEKLNTITMKYYLSNQDGNTGSLETYLIELKNISVKWN